MDSSGEDLVDFIAQLQESESGLKTERCLQVHSAHRAARRERASLQRIRLREKRRAQYSAGITKIDLVEHVSHVEAERQIVTAI